MDQSLQVFVNELRLQLGLDPLFAFDRTGRTNRWEAGLHAQPFDIEEEVHLANFANGLRDSLGLVPLYAFEKDGTTKDWRLGMPYKFFFELKR